MAENNQDEKVQNYINKRKSFEKCGRKPYIINKGKPFVSAVVCFAAGRDKEVKFDQSTATIYEFQNPEERSIPANNNSGNGNDGKEVA